MTCGEKSFLKGHKYTCKDISFYVSGASDVMFYNELNQPHWLGSAWAKYFKSTELKGFKASKAKCRKSEIIEILNTKIKILEDRKTFYDCAEYRRDGALGELQDLLEYLEGESDLYLTPHKS